MCSKTCSNRVTNTDTDTFSDQVANAYTNTCTSTWLPQVRMAESLPLACCNHCSEQQHSHRHGSHSAYSTHLKAQPSHPTIVPITAICSGKRRPSEAGENTEHNAANVQTISTAASPLRCIYCRTFAKNAKNCNDESSQTAQKSGCTKRSNKDSCSFDSTEDS